MLPIIRNEFHGIKFTIGVNFLWSVVVNLITYWCVDRGIGTVQLSTLIGSVNSRSLSKTIHYFSVRERKVKKQTEVRLC